MPPRAGGMARVMADVALPHVLAADRDRSRGDGYAISKRILDITIALLTLAILSPLLLVIALAIKLASPGPVIYAQRRLRGRRVRTDDGPAWTIEPFTLYKFRTMVDGADQTTHREYMHAYLAGDEEKLTALRPGRKAGESYRPANDPRVTRIGAVLRKYSLDEVPQLWNVVKGQMSLVGPRPPVPYEIEKYQDHHLKRLACRPGITGWAQVRGRAGIGFEEMVRLDMEYIGRRSILFDLKVLLVTVPVVLLTKGAD